MNGRNEEAFSAVGVKAKKLDGPALVTGRGPYTDDLHPHGMLHAGILRSPHAHARIMEIRTEKACALPGVQAVLTWQDVPRIPYTTAGQGYPEPSPYDSFMLDRKVRFAGDRVAAVAADTLGIAEEALKLIEVKYEMLPAILHPEEALKPGAPVIHDEEDASGIYDAPKNLAAYISAGVGDLERGLLEADFILENEYRVHYVQQAPMEPHVCITWLDENNRLVIRTSTQVPFHCRRIVARLLKLPVSRVRVIKPRIGGGFGVKQEILIEDICGMLTLVTRRPVRLALTRREEFISSRTRHPQVLRMKTGLKKDGTLTANQLTVLANTGAYGAHSLTVPSNTGSKSLPLYPCPNQKFEAQVVYTNLPVAGAFRGYGGPQGFFALDCQMDEAARALGMDPLEFKRRRCLKKGDLLPLAEVLGEGKPGYRQVIKSCGMEECIDKAASAIGWGRPLLKPEKTYLKRGRGCALLMHGSGIPGVDMGAAFIKMNEDGSFNLLVGATDLGTGSDTVLSQIAAEVLRVPTEKIIPCSSDTDCTPFDVGAYASSTTYISGQAVKAAAEECLRQILMVAGRMLDEKPELLSVREGRVFSPSGKSFDYTEIALHSFYRDEMLQIMGTASHFSYDCPPPFGAMFAEVEVDVDTGQVRVLKFASAIDCGTAVNPPLAEGQINGAVAMALGYALTEEMIFDEKGRMMNPTFFDYKTMGSLDMPEMHTFLVESWEPTGPFGAKSVSEIPMDGPAPAVANAIFDAIGLRLRELPFTAERVLGAIKKNYEL
ncbi:MAG: molybdopterin cofactor-binding domain-containing protein [bacterium]